VRAARRGAVGGAPRTCQTITDKHPRKPPWRVKSART
jgi:hypothetical protein